MKANSFIAAASIYVDGDRQRKYFDEKAHEELVDSIRRVGLINAPVIRFNANQQPYIVAGERRLRAVIALNEKYMYGEHEIPKGMIPIVSLGEAEDRLHKQVELIENITRLDLTWQEKDAAIAEVAELVRELAEPDVVITLDNIADVVTKKGAGNSNSYDRMKVQDALRRQEYADDPLVCAAKSAKDADKIILKKLTEEKKKRLADEFKEIETPHTIIFGDSLVEIRGVKDKSIDVICADPIYGIDMHEHNAFQRVKMQEGKRHEYDDSYEAWQKMFDVMPFELFRVCREQAHCYLFCDLQRFEELKERMEDAGWDVWNRPLIWYKGNIGSLPRPEHGPRYTYEVILYAIKGDKKTTGVYHDVITTPQTTGHSHGAGKPPTLYKEVLQRSVSPGDTVLDFCAGSFPILPAANSLSVKAVAIELDRRWENDAAIRKQQSIE